MLKEINDLISMFSKISGLGAKAAKKTVFALLDNKNKIDDLLSVLENAQKNIFKCSVCGNFDSTPTCSICNSTTRDNSLLCIVENAQDLFMIENMRIFNGKYFVLGTLFPDIETNPQGISQIESLKSLCTSCGIEEVILALNITLEGKITAFHIKEQLSALNIKITSLATGIPVGGEIGFLDEGTLKAAFLDRK